MGLSAGAGGALWVPDLRPTPCLPPSAPQPGPQGGLSLEAPEGLFRFLFANSRKFGAAVVAPRVEGWAVPARAQAGLWGPAQSTGVVSGLMDVDLRGLPASWPLGCGEPGTPGS